MAENNNLLRERVQLLDTIKKKQAELGKEAG
jgi:hypothetical protein